MCLGRIEIGDVCFHVDILRLSRICNLKVYILIFIVGGGDFITSQSISSIAEL